MADDAQGSLTDEMEDDSHQHWNNGDEQTSPTEDDGNGGREGGQSLTPMQKRRRVTRACDTCRGKKIKCDGKQPCTHCTVYSYGGSS